MWSASRPRSMTTPHEEEESASLTRNVDASASSSWSRSNLLDPGDNSSSLEKGAGGVSNSRRSSWSMEFRRLMDRKGVKWVAVLCSVLFLGVLWHQSRIGGSYSGRLDQGRPWKKFGNSKLVDLGMHEGRLPLCERTMLVDWSSFGYGFGSTATTVLQAGIVAKMHGYTILFSRGANKYGRYLDFFEPAPLDCRAPEELYDPATYVDKEGNAIHVGPAINDQFERPQANRLLMSIDDVHHLNHHIVTLVYPQMPILDSLPTLDASKPVPISSNIPQVFAESFDRYSALTAEHFKLNGLLNAKVSSEVARLGLDKKDPVFPTAAVHWRGGDKLERECVGSSQLSCGNVTHHCATAWDSFPPSYQSSTLLHKPRLLLMTTEPDALGLFRADPFCKKFDIELLENSEEKQSFVQDTWNQLSDSERAEDAKSMFVGSEILANHVDVAVVSPNSNLARIIMTRAGPRRSSDGSIRSVDIYWHPVHYPPFKSTKTWGGCDGTWGGCWPSG